MRTKIIIAFIIPILFLILTVLMAVSSMGKIDRAVNSMTEEQMNVLQQKLDDIGADEKKAEIIVETLTEAQIDDMKSIDRTVELAELANVAFVVVAILVVVILSLMLTRMIVKSVDQLSYA
ncbi:MAG: hypothetical protein K2K97_02670, partial [Muribaculaceae bacterium]|nr:hypothetical protein [Muribaculaceae bacterium]